MNKLITLITTNDANASNRDGDNNRIRPIWT